MTAVDLALHLIALHQIDRDDVPLVLLDKAVAVLANQLDMAGAPPRRSIESRADAERERERESQKQAYPVTHELEMIRQYNILLRQKLAVQDLAKQYLGLSPLDRITKATVTSPDQFLVTVDVSLLLLVLGGEYAKFVEEVEKRAAEMKANTKSYLAGAGVALGKE